MRFLELKNGDKFETEGIQYLRIQDVMVGCCEVEYNAKELATGRYVLIPSTRPVRRLK